MNALQILGNIDPIPRRQFNDEFRENTDYYVDMARKLKLPVQEIMRRHSPTQEQGYPEDCIHDLLYRNGVCVKSTLSQPATLFNEAYEVPHIRQLIFAYMDDVYERSFWGSAYDYLSRASDISSTLSNLTVNTAWRPIFDRPIGEKKMIAPQIRIGMLIAEIETQDDDVVRDSDYDVPTVDETMRNIAEGAEIPTVEMKASDDFKKMKKVGIGLELTDEFLDSDIRMSLVRKWVMRVAIVHEISLVIECVNILRDTAVRVDATGIPIGDDLDGIIDVGFEMEEPYMTTELVCPKALAKKWVKAVITATNAEPFPAGRFSSLFGGIEVRNMTSSPDGLSHVKGTNLAENEMLGIDTRFAINLFRKTRGSVNETDRNAGRQVQTRYLTERYLLKEDDENAVVRFVVA